MLNRRQFISHSAQATLALGFAGLHSSHENALIEKVGIQFFSLPKMLENDLAGAVKMLSSIGYKEAELYGPYSFSTEKAKASWNAVTPSLGFSGSGFFGHTAKEMSALLSEHGISVPSMHTDLDTLENGMDKLGEAAHIIGNEFVVLPAIPGDKRKTLDDYKRMAESFNKIGAAARRQGIKFAYHNHGYGLHPMEGKIPLEVIQENTDAGLVYFEMDLYWTTAGGADPVALLKKNKGRYRLMHVKDMMKQVRFSGDGGDSKQWIELFQYMTTAGNGVLDLKTILPKAKEYGVQHFIVEQDMVKDPEINLKKSYDYLASL